MSENCPKVLETQLLFKKDSVLQFTTIKIKINAMEHELIPIGTSRQFFLLLEEFLTGTGPRQRQVKCHSFHWQDVPSPPFSQGRICSVTIRHLGKEATLSRHSPTHPGSCQGMIRRPKRGNTAQALGAGIQSVYSSIST